MKTGKTLVELATELDRQRNAARDFIVATNACRMTASEENVLVHFGPQTFPATDIAHEQIAGALDIPVKYYKKMQTENPSLLCENTNSWFSKNKNGKRLARSLDGNLRAFLSDKYRPLDNYELAEVALPVLQQSGCVVESCEVTDKRLYLKAITPQVTTEVKKGDVVQAGIVLSNSEVGCGALTIEPLVYRLVCTNGMIVPDAKLRKAHLGRTSGGLDSYQEFFRDETRVADDRALWLKVRDVIGLALSEKGFMNFVEKLQAATTDRVTKDPVEFVEVAKKHFGLSDDEHRAVLRHYLVDDDFTRYGFAQAVTRSAQDVPSYDRATELERIGGAVIELPRRDWSVLAA